MDCKATTKRVNYDSNEEVYLSVNEVDDLCEAPKPTDIPKRDVNQADASSKKKKKKAEGRKSSMPSASKESKSKCKKVMPIKDAKKKKKKKRMGDEKMPPVIANHKTKIGSMSVAGEPCLQVVEPRSEALSYSFARL